MRACPHCTEKCVRQLAHICSIGRGSVRAATAGTVAPSHPLLKFGKLTTKLEMLCKEAKSQQFQKICCRTKQSKLVSSSFLLLSMGQLFPFPQTKRKSCLKVTLKSIRRISRAWSSRFAVQLTGTNRGGEDRFLRKERRETPASPFGCR